MKLNKESFKYTGVNKLSSLPIFSHGAFNIQLIDLNALEIVKKSFESKYIFFMENNPVLFHRLT